MKKEKNSLINLTRKEKLALKLKENLSRRKDKSLQDKPNNENQEDNER